MHNPTKHYNLQFYYGIALVFSMSYQRQDQEGKRAVKSLIRKGIDWQYCNVYCARGKNFIQQIINTDYTELEIINTKNIQRAIDKNEKYFYNVITKKRCEISPQQYSLSCVAGFYK